MADLPPLRQVIADAGLRAKKSLGQNFLLDLNLTRRIARAAAPLDQGSIIEVGPGPGGLSRALLLEGATFLILIEKDLRCRPALEALAAHYPGQVDLHFGAAETLDLTGLGQAPRKIVANLPYNVATPLLIGWLKAIWRDETAFSGMTLMFQKEVAQRIAAAPGSRSYGRLSVLAQWLCRTECLFDVPPEAFTPAPKVTSSLVGFTPRSGVAKLADFALVEKLTAAAFGQRRKMLRQSLKSLRPDAEAFLNAQDIDPTRRAETLSVDEVLRLAAALTP